MPPKNMEKTEIKTAEPKAATVMPRKEGKRRTGTVILVLLLLASIGYAGYLFNQVRVLKQNPEKQAQEESAKLVAEVGKLIVLPEGENPTIATVNDPEKLKSQPFFANAKVGDKVLIYTNAKKAILYRPSENKIIEVAPLNIGTPSAEKPAAAQPTPAPATNSNQ